jgi:hypothetical protein
MPMVIGGALICSGGVGRGAIGTVSTGVLQAKECLQDHENAEKRQQPGHDRDSTSVALPQILVEVGRVGKPPEGLRLRLLRCPFVERLVETTSGRAGASRFSTAALRRALPRTDRTRLFGLVGRCPTTAPNKRDLPKYSFARWTVRWTVLSASGRFLAVRSGCHVRTRNGRIPSSGGKFLQILQCRRRDSNPRHADYDSAALTD